MFGRHATCRRVGHLASVAFLALATSLFLPLTTEAAPIFASRFLLFGAGYSYSSSVAIGDLNADGKPDLAVVEIPAGYGPSTALVLLGNGDGTFRTASNFTIGNFPSSVVIGDVNGDRRLDLVVACKYSNSVSVLLGNGNGTFGTRNDYVTGGDPVSVAIADFNGDGKPDLAVANEYSNSVSVLLGNGQGIFGSKTDYGTGDSPASVAIADLN